MEKTATPKTQALLVSMLVSIALMRLLLVFINEANWDEYLNLSMVYMHERGELREILQTGFVHIFKWVTVISDNEADQIIAARLLYFVIGLVTSAAMWGTARRLVSPNAALFVVLCYWAIDYNFIHAVSLRTDPLAVCALMSALYIIISRPPSFTLAIAAGFLTGLAGFFTIKAIFYVPSLALIALLLCNKLTPIKHIIIVLAAGLTAAASFLLLNIIHAFTFPEISSPIAFLSRTSNSTLGGGGYRVLYSYLSNALANNFVVSVAIITGACVLLMQLGHRHNDRITLVSLALLFPAISFLIYRDTYPYFYPFILAPVMIACGFFWDALAQRNYERILIPITGAVFLIPILTTLENTQRNISNQRDTLRAIHQTFPNSVTYIDGRSMVASLPKRGLFMSTWGMTDYRYIGHPIMADIILAEQPQFMLANIVDLQIDKFTPEMSQAAPLGLLAADVHTLQDTFVKFWGPLYIPGKTIEHGDRSMRILISGYYRLTSQSQIEIEGKTLKPNTAIHLVSGNYRVRTSQRSTLILDVPRPTQKEPIKALFSGF